MTCPDCHRTAQRLRELEERLGVARRLGAIGAVADHLGLRATEARILLRLYEAGAPVLKGALLDVISSHSEGALKSWVYEIRKSLGPGVIQTFRGGAYGLSAKGRSMVLAALERPDFQEARP